MAAEYGYIAEQTIAAGGSAALNDFTPCQSGLVVHENESPVLTLRGIGNSGPTCPCRRKDFVQYRITANGNISIPDGGTLGPISVAFTLNGIIIPASQVILTPGALGDFNPFSIDKLVPATLGTSPSFALSNVLPGLTTTETGQAIVMRNLNIIVDRVND